MRWKFIRCSLIGSLAVVLFLSGCGKGGNELLPSPQEMALKLVEEVGSVSMTQVQESYIPARFDIEPSLLESSSLYISTDQDVSDEIGVFQARDKKNVDSLFESLSIHNNQKAQTFRLINSNEYQKVCSTLLISKEAYVFMVTSSQPVRAKVLINRFFTDEKTQSIEKERLA